MNSCDTLRKKNQKFRVGNFTFATKVTIRPPNSFVILQGTSRVGCRIPETSALGIWQAKTSTELLIE